MQNRPQINKIHNYMHLWDASIGSQASAPPGSVRQGRCMVGSPFRFIEENDHDY